jgi:hypothetical protein
LRTSGVLFSEFADVCNMVSVGMITLSMLVMAVKSCFVVVAVGIFRNCEKRNEICQPTNLCCNNTVKVRCCGLLCCSSLWSCCGVVVEFNVEAD